MNMPPRAEATATTRADNELSVAEAAVKSMPTRATFSHMAPKSRGRDAVEQKAADENHRYRDVEQREDLRVRVRAEPAVDAVGEALARPVAVARRQQVVDAPERDRGGGDADQRRRERREARRRERLVIFGGDRGVIGAGAGLLRRRDVVRHAAGIHVSCRTEVSKLCSQASHGAQLRGILPGQLLQF